VSTIPHLVQREVAAAAIVVAGILLFSMLVPAPLEDLANPLHSPNPAKAAWYFAGLQELLLHMHALAAMALAAIVLLGMALLPALDRREEDIGLYFRSTTGRKAALLGAFLALDLVPLLILADEFWLDLAGLLPAWPVLITTGLLPLLLTLLGLAAIYLALRLLLKAAHGEALVGLFVFIVAGLLILTLTGVYFRGPNMALVLPF
jgi:hypothetical protein